MKNSTFTSIIIFTLIITPLSLQAKNEESGGIHEAGTGIENPEIKEEGQGSGQGMQIQADELIEIEENAQNGARNIIMSETPKQMQNSSGTEEMIGTMQNQNRQGQSDNSDSVEQSIDNGEQRRSRVANAVQAMLQIAENNQGVGEQIRTIAQTQSQEQEGLETDVETIQNRGGLKKFFFGADYKTINSAEEKIANYEEKLAKLEGLTVQLVDEDDIIVLQEQIQVMEEVKAELEEKIAEASQGFSLFGWLNKMLAD